MATPNATITKNIALAPDGWKRTAFPDGSVPNAGPSAPPAFTTSKTSSSITATITNANGATSYNVRVNTGAAVAGLTVSGLAAETAYSFQVQGVNEFGSSDWSASVSVTTDAAATGGGTGDISWTGTVAHGQTLTITDAQSRFGTRANAQPLLVCLGDIKGSSALGRLTNNYFPTLAVWQSAIKLGSVPGAVGLDHYNNYQDALIEGVSFDAAKPLIQYVERYRGYDITNPAVQSPTSGFNLKTNRYWVTTSPSGPNNLYVGYQGTEGSGSIRFFVENAGGPDINTRDYYGALSCTSFEWESDEFLFENCSAPDANDGTFEHRRNFVLYNENSEILRTRTSSNPNPLAAAYLDQVTSTSASAITYLGYTCWDDEYNGVYLGDAATRGSCTKLVRLPQTAWAPGQVSVHLIESHVALSTGHLYFRTGKTSWVSDSGVPLS